MIHSKKDAPVIQTLGVEYLPAPFEEHLQGGDVIYGWAPIGTAETDEGWRIMKETTVGGVIKRLYAQGSMDFRFKWSERANYNYAR